MPIHDNDPHPTGDGAPRVSSSHRSQPSKSSPPPARSRLRKLFTVPAPVKQLFDRFPLVTYPPNILPRQLSSPGGETELPTLYIYATAEDAVLGKPSFNPSCLKWQVRSSFFSSSPSHGDADSTSTDLPQVRGCQVPDCLFQQPRLAQWRSPLPPPVAPRQLTSSPDALLDPSHPLQ